MSQESSPQTSEKVLPTLNEDGSRNWIQPRLSKGKFHAWRQKVAWALIFVFMLLPHLRFGEHPLFLLDLPNRRFTLFGTTFLPTDTLLLLFLVLGLFLGIFLITAVTGRAWCGWTCPQTVYMEFLFRPIEHLLEGGTPAQRRRLDASGGFWRKPLKWFVFLVLSGVLAHTFLAYFVGVDALQKWIFQSPFLHPVPFAIMLFVTVAIFVDFAYFREQTCLVVCPYGRFQSVLLDRQSLIVGYDINRGEPRGRNAARKKARDADSSKDFGDCIECGACVVTCPTGIDIRNGLQMECVNCTQCIDACDAIMERVGKPKGLIRYTSQAELEGGKWGFWRPRVIIYPLLLLIVSGAFFWNLSMRQSAKVTLLRQGRVPYRVLTDGQISNQISIKIANLGKTTRKFHISLAKKNVGLKMIAPLNPVLVKSGHLELSTVFILVSAKLFEGNKTPHVHFVVTDGKGFKTEQSHKLIGPIQ